jgi:ATP-dependent Clp protease ATP-binding subunit ClpB
MNSLSPQRHFYPPIRTFFTENWHSLEEMTNELTFSQNSIANWPTSKVAIRACIEDQQHDLVGLDNFLKRIIAYGAEIDIDQTLTFISTIIDLPLLEHVIRQKTATSASSSEADPQSNFVNALQWAIERQHQFPSPLQSNRNQRNHELWHHLETQVISFIPNLINIFLSAFDLINIHKKYTSLWDKYLLIEIIYKFFIIPSCLVKILKPVYGTSIKVYFVSGLIMASLATFLACYKRWLRPLPSEIVNCRNLSQSLNLEERMRIHGQTESMQRLIASLLGGSNVLLVGRSGEGKTALIRHLVQLQNEKRLPHDLQDKTFFKFDCTMINSNGTVGYREMINQTFEQIEGNSDKVIFILDEFSQVLGNPMAFHLIKERFLKDKPPFRFIAVLTQEEFSRLMNSDPDRSFEREMTTIAVDSSEDVQQLRLMLHGLVDRWAQDLPIKPEAYSEIIERSNDDRFLRNIGRPAKIEKILKEAIGRCRYAYHPNFIPNELARMHQRRRILQREYRANLTPATLQQPLPVIHELNQQIATYEDRLAEQKCSIEKVRSFYRNYERATQKYVRETYELTRHRPSPVSQENDALSTSAQITYLLRAFYLIETLKVAVDREINLIPQEFPIQISVELIRQVCDDLTRQEELFHESNQNRTAMPSPE